MIETDFMPFTPLPMPIIDWIEGTKAPLPRLKVGQYLWWNLHSRIPHYLMTTVDSS